MYEIEDVEWIIWNSAIGIRDFVTIGHVDTQENVAWLESPYQMVGPFSIEELTTQGEISFAECVVMSKQKWQDERESLLTISMMRRRKAQQEFFEELEKQNRRKQYNHTHELEEFRTLLNLPISGTLEISQINRPTEKLPKKPIPMQVEPKRCFYELKRRMILCWSGSNHNVICIKLSAHIFK